MRGDENKEAAEDLNQVFKATNEIGSGAVPPANPGALANEPSAEYSAPASPTIFAPSGHDLTDDAGGATSKALAQKNLMPIPNEVRRSSALFISFREGPAVAGWHELCNVRLADATGMCRRCRRAVCAVQP